METTKDKGGNVVEGLTRNEKLFYEDKRDEHRHLLIQEIDTDMKQNNWKYNRQK